MIEFVFYSMAEPDRNRKRNTLIIFSLIFLTAGIVCFSLYSILERFVAEVLSILLYNTIYAQYIVIGISSVLLVIGIIFAILTYREWRKKKRGIYDTFA